MSDNQSIDGYSLAEGASLCAGCNLLFKTRKELHDHMLEKHTPKGSGVYIVSSSEDHMSFSRVSEEKKP